MTLLGFFERAAAHRDARGAERVGLAARAGRSACAAVGAWLVLASVGTAESAAQPAADAASTVRVWKTSPTGGERLTPSSDANFASGRDPGFHPVRVDAGQRFQSMVGFGAALTDSSAYDLWYLQSQAQRDETMSSLFDSAGGIGLSTLRVPMGASDFSRTDYTYDDLPPGETDPGLERFSIAHDEAYILPLLRQARALNPSLSVIATPWSAPAWMKTNGTTHGGSLAPAYYDVWARYFVRFIQAYEAAGVPIFAVTVQNEPEFSTDAYPSMRLTSAEEAEFVGRHLGPALAAAGLQTKIIAYDHNWNDMDYPLGVLNDPVAGPYVDGIGWHGYAGESDAQTSVHDAHPEKSVYFTEVSGSAGSDFAEDLKWDLHAVLIGATRRYARTALLWNLALDEHNGPLNGGYANGRGVIAIDSATGRVTRNVEYYALAHSARFVRPGAVRIASDDYGSGWVETVAYQNPDGSRVLIAVCTAQTAQSFEVVEGDESFPYRLQPGDVATFVWN